VRVGAWAGVKGGARAARRVWRMACYSALPAADARGEKSVGEKAALSVGCEAVATGSWWVAQSAGQLASQMAASKAGP